MATILNHLRDPEALESGRLIAQVSDVSLLLNLAPVIAAPLNEAEVLINREIDPNEKRQLNNAYLQVQAFHAAIQETLTDANDEYTKWGFGDQIDFIPTAASFPGMLARAMKGHGTSEGLIESLQRDLQNALFSGGTVARLKIATDVLALSLYPDVQMNADQKAFLSQLAAALAAFEREQNSLEQDMN
ncbi:MAG: hypothetical protein AB7G93_22350 [Bdellovibrionales bacterium]